MIITWFMLKGGIIMKRKVSLILVLTVILLTACNTNNLAEYKKAAEKTDQIIRGQTTGEFSLITEFDREGLTPEEIRELNYIKDMSGSFNVVYDDEEERSIIRNYLNFGGLGYDFEVYINGEEMFMKLPVVGKYIKIDDMSSLSDEMYHTEDEIVSEDTIAEFSKKWISLMNEEDVFKGKDIVVTTPDGEVKTKEYVIKLNDEQIKILLKDSVEIFSKDNDLKKLYEENIRTMVEPLKDKTFEELLLDIKNNTDKYYVENFTFTAYVDIDGYIVNQIIEVFLKAKDVDKGGVESFRYSLNIKNWDINKKQSFDFPVLTDENTMNIEDMDGDMPASMKDFFGNKN